MEKFFYNKGHVCYCLQKHFPIFQNKKIRFFAPSFGVVVIFRFILFFQRFHNWMLNQFHMMRVVDILGIALSCAIHDAIIENVLFEYGDGTNTFRVFNPTQGKKTYSMVIDNKKIVFYFLLSRTNMHYD